MSDPTAKLPTPTSDETLTRLKHEEIDLDSVLVVDPAVLNADSDPQSDWVRATTEGIGNMTADEWMAWVAVHEPIAA
jgi:hypothetical protein